MSRRRRPSPAVLLAAALSATVGTGCRGWARVQAGNAYNMAGRTGHSGQVLSADGAIGLRNVRWFNSDQPVPFAVHTSADVILAPDRKSYGWGTGLVFYREPRPVSAYALGGSSLHFDDINGRFSFGNVSPYGELGVMASIPARFENGGSGTLVTLGVAGASYINYLVGGANTVDGFLLFKLGVGWEMNAATALAKDRLAPGPSERPPPPPAEVSSASSVGPVRAAPSPL